jgi:hypothetical protein
MIDYQWVVISGNPVDGFFYYGPFDSAEAAASAAEDSVLDADWWISKLLLNLPS